MKTIQELMDLSGKAAIVTGGARGIGYGIAYRLAEAGAKVIIADLDGAAADQAVNTLREAGWIAESHQIDVSNEGAVIHLVATCKEKFGSVDILVNNAGIYPSAPLSEMNSEEFERVMHVNLRSVFLTTKHASEAMKEQGGGKIINITSIDALHPSAVGLAHYDASKHGVWGFTKNTALELAEYKIWVNAIAPGSISTPGVQNILQTIPEDVLETAMNAAHEKIPMHRTGDPDDIGTVALFLASGLSSYMTGEQIVVDGGVLLR